MASDDEIYVYIVQQDLVAIISGGTSITVSIGNNVTLDATAMSYDPDDLSNSVPLSYEWSCATGVAPTTGASFQLSDCPANLHYVYDLPNTTGSLTLDTSGWNATEYIFRVRVFKVGRHVRWLSAPKLSASSGPESTSWCSYSTC